MSSNTDILGSALMAFYYDDDQDKLMILADQMEIDEMPIAYYFRNFNIMPEIEKRALKRCAGKVLDVGAGGGSHALWLQSQNISVTALDISVGCIRVMKDRGVKSVINHDILDFKHQKFDTILLLMNGIGISKNLDRLNDFLTHLKTLLNENGQVLFDSADLQYLYTDEDGSMLLDLNGSYYGEMSFRFAYKGIKGPWFKWLYIDEFLMEEYSNKAGFNMEIIYRGDSFNYLARLTHS